MACWRHCRAKNVVKYAAKMASFSLYSRLSHFAFSALNTIKKFLNWCLFHLNMIDGCLRCSLQIGWLTRVLDPPVLHLAGWNRPPQSEHAWPKSIVDQGDIGERLCTLSKQFVLTGICFLWFLCHLTCTIVFRLCCKYPKCNAALFSRTWFVRVVYWFVSVSHRTNCFSPDRKWASCSSKIWSKTDRCKT